RAVLGCHSAPLLRLPRESEESAAVQPLQRLLHPLARDDARVVFAQDDVDRSTQLGQQGDALDAHGDQDRQETDETEDQLGAQPWAEMRMLYHAQSMGLAAERSPEEVRKNF